VDVDASGCEEGRFTGSFPDEYDVMLWVSCSGDNSCSWQASERLAGSREQLLWVVIVVNHVALTLRARHEAELQPRTSIRTCEIGLENAPNPNNGISAGGSEQLLKKGACVSHTIVRPDPKFTHSWR
jgi:hypothetical protein